MYVRATGVSCAVPSLSYLNMVSAVVPMSAACMTPLWMRYMTLLIFFFQAEDGIRDYKVTGVQTCALPIFVQGRRVAGADSFAVGNIAPHGRGGPDREGFPDLGDSEPLRVARRLGAGLHEIGRASCWGRV